MARLWWLVPMPHHWMRWWATIMAVSNKAVNFVEGITAAVDAGTRVEYDLGCDYTDTVHFGGIWAAGNADITVAVLGLNARYMKEKKAMLFLQQVVATEKA